MVSTRAASQLPATQTSTAQPPVDHFSYADLTDVEELERQLAVSTAGTEQTVNTGAGQPSPLQPEDEPQNATPPTAQQIAHLLQGLQAPSPAPQTTINDAVLTTLTQTVTALTAHLATPGGFTMESQSKKPCPNGRQF
jgi:hypothetical protein